MSKDRQPMRIEPEDSSAILAWLKDAVRQVRLTWRLLLDGRVPLWTKVIPPAALAYVVFPADILPDVALGLGQLDDIAVLLLGIKLFIELAPPEVVREHLKALGSRVEEWRVVDEEGKPSVVEGTYKIKEPGTQEPEAKER